MSPFSACDAVRSSVLPIAGATQPSNYYNEYCSPLRRATQQGPGTRQAPILVKLFCCWSAVLRSRLAEAISSRFGSHVVRRMLLLIFPAGKGIGPIVRMIGTWIRARKEVLMRERKIHITDFDMQRLQKLLEGSHNWSQRDREYLEDLEAELERAVLISSRKVPPDIVTMNSQIRVRDLDTDKEMTIQLVFPSEADYEQGKISVMAPIGTALIGYGVGDVVEWKVPAGMRRLRIEEVIYQPEPAGQVS